MNRGVTELTQKNIIAVGDKRAVTTESLRGESQLQKADGTRKHGQISDLHSQVRLGRFKLKHPILTLRSLVDRNNPPGAPLFGEEPGLFFCRMVLATLTHITSP